jgi:hypothetical protein
MAKISNMVIPENWNDLVYETSTTLSAFSDSGIIIRSADYDRKAAEKGFLLHVPYMNPLASPGQILSKDTNLNPTAIQGAEMKTPKIGRGYPVDVFDIESAAEGKDLVQFVRSSMGKVLADARQTMLITILGGLFNPTGGALYGSHCNDISGEEGDAGVISGDAILDTVGLLGDASDGLVGAACNMQTAIKLMKLGVVSVDYIPDLIAPERTRAVYRLNGQRLVIDDGIAAAGDVQTVYLFGLGAFAYGAGVPAGEVQAEVQRSPLTGGGKTTFIQRSWELLHPQGMSFAGSFAGDTPTNAELGAAASWTKQYDDKNIKIVALKGLLEAAPEE